MLAYWKSLIDSTFKWLHLKMVRGIYITLVLCISETLTLNFTILEHYPVRNAPIYKSEGESVTLTCQVNNHFDSCAWTHNNGTMAVDVCKVTYTWEWNETLAHYKSKPYTEKICDNRRLEMPPDELYRNCVLNIKRVVPDDYGTWTCLVRDWQTGLEDSHQFSLVVRPRSYNQPLIESQPFHIKEYSPKVDTAKNVGDWVTMSCQVTDHYDSCEWIHVHRITLKRTTCKLEYKWEWDHKNAHYRDKPTQKKHCPDQRLVLPPNEEFINCYLTIQEVKPEDNGNWKCVVKDLGLASEDSNVFNLIVLDKPSEEDRHVKQDSPYMFNPRFSWPLLEDEEEEVQPEAKMIFGKNRPNSAVRVPNPEETSPGNILSDMTVWIYISVCCVLLGIGWCVSARMKRGWVRAPIE